MSYQVFYVECSDKLTTGQSSQERSVNENFDTEDQALSRARELLEDGYYHTVMIRYSSGQVLSGIRLQLMMGYGRTSE